MSHSQRSITAASDKVLCDLIERATNRLIVLAPAAIAALCREVRLRRALQDLLRRLFSHWRPHETLQDDRVDRRSGSRRV